MRNVQRLIAAAALTCVLALPAFAGHIATGAPTSEPSPTLSSATSATGTDCEAGDSMAREALSSPLTEAALSLINSLLGLL